MHSSRQFVIFRIFTSEVSMRGGLLSKVGHTMPSGVTKMQPLTFPSSVLFKNSRILRTLVNRPSPDPTPEVGVGHLSGWRRCSVDPKFWTMVMNGQVERILPNVRPIFEADACVHALQALNHWQIPLHEWQGKVITRWYMAPFVPHIPGYSLVTNFFPGQILV